MAETPHYHWTLTTREEEQTTTVEEWMRRIAEDEDDSFLMDLDRRLHHSSAWSRYLGEELTGLSLVDTTIASIPAMPLVLTQCTGETFDAVTDVAGFNRSATHYVVDTSFATAEVSLYPETTALHNQYLTVVCDGTSSGPYYIGGTTSSPIPLSLKSGQAEHNIEIFAHDSSQSKSGTHYFIRIQQANKLKLHTMSIGGLTGTWDHANELCVGDAIPDSNAVWGFAQDSPAYCFKANTLDIFPILSISAPSGTVVSIRSSDGLQWASFDGTAVSGSNDFSQMSTAVTEVDGISQITFTGTFLLDPSQNGSQRYQVCLTNSAGDYGGYWITAYRDPGDGKLELRTHLKGTVGAVVRHDAIVTVYKKSEAMRYYSVEDLKEQGKLAGETHGALFDAAIASGFLTQVYQMDVVSSYHIPPEALPSEPGVYTLVLSKVGFLDYVVDNIILTLTGIEAEYDLGKFNLRAGDVNHDGTVNVEDATLFDIAMKYFSGDDTIDPTILEGYTINNFDFNRDGYVEFRDRGHLLTNLPDDFGHFNNIKVKKKVYLSAYQ